MDCYEKTEPVVFILQLKQDFFSEVGVEAYNLYMKSKHYPQKT